MNHCSDCRCWNPDKGVDLVRMGEVLGKVMVQDPLSVSTPAGSVGLCQARPPPGGLFSRQPHTRPDDGCYHDFVPKWPKQYDGGDA